MRYGCFVFFLAKALSATAAVTAATCLDIPAIDGPTGYRHRTDPDRCEGLYRAPIAGESLELLSFVTGRIAFDPRASQVLVISAPDTTSLGSPPIAVVARSLPFRVYYRMDATVGSKGTLQWPLADVVIPAGLGPSSVGLTGSVQQNGHTVFVPLQVSPTGPSPATTDAATITFRSPTDLERFQWRLRKSGDPAPAWNTFGRKDDIVRAGDPIALRLDAPTGGVATLDLAAKPVGSEYIPEQYWIFVP